jgi:hypothetical protein
VVKFVKTRRKKKTANPRTNWEIINPEGAKYTGSTHRRDSCGRSSNEWIILTARLHLQSVNVLEDKTACHVLNVCKEILWRLLQVTKKCGGPFGLLWPSVYGV